MVGMEGAASSTYRFYFVKSKRLSLRFLTELTEFIELQTSADSEPLIPLLVSKTTVKGTTEDQEKK